MSTTPNTPPVSKEQAATRKVVTAIAEMDGTDTHDMDAIETANKAVENIAEMGDRIAELETRLEAVEERAPNPAEMEYARMGKAEKATVVRSKLKHEAEATGGTASAQYKEIIRMFDGNPSAGHAYDLMDAAAEIEGFNVGTNPEGTKRLTCRLEAVDEV